MDFNKITNKELDEIDLTKISNFINSLEYQNYFISKSGIDHYRLLSFISLNENDINILDIGSLKGCSALAFSINPNNNVTSFNIINELDLNFIPNNINFIIDNVINGNYDDLIMNSKYIMLDTFHDASFEKEFLNHLIKLNYKGFLLLDDIYLNDEMKIFWSSMKLEKYDISKIGHVTGTGLVSFK
jgi:hypothetical protein